MYIIFLWYTLVYHLSKNLSVIVERFFIHTTTPLSSQCRNILPRLFRLLLCKSHTRAYWYAYHLLVLGPYRTKVKNYHVPQTLRLFPHRERFLFLQKRF